MKRSGRVTFVVVALLIFAFAFVSFFGVSNYYGDTKHVIFKGTDDIRWGIDIQGGVEAIFTPDVAEDEVSGITAEEMESAETIITNRLVNKNITNYEIYTDNENHQIIVRFPWQSDNEDYNPQDEVKDLGETALVTFRKGQQDANGDIILQGAADVESATASYDAQQGFYVALNLTSEGSSKFATATSELQQQYISIYMDDQCISAPKVNSVITNGKAIITGMQNADESKALADKINAGSLPFALTIDDTIRVINPTLGEASLSVMLLAGIIAFAAIVIITGVSLGGEAGFLCACLIMMISNMFFGQGPWTPWQMFSYGMIGYLAGILFQKGILKARKVDLCIYGFLSVFLIFGGIMNPASILMAYGYITKKSLIAFYISGAPVDLVQATSTVIFLWILSRPLLEKLERVKRKYGLLQRPENKEENEYDKE